MKYLSKIRLIHTALLLASIMLAVNPANSTIIGADGGITKCESHFLILGTNLTSTGGLSVSGKAPNHPT